MSRLRLLSAAALLAVAANASATSLIVTTDSIVGALKATSDATSDA
ncbi:holliday junction resolvasome, helicase subunit, partial [Klebsiella pneumoniae]|nr:holliday junction resolvasome, helicase subunit [Klebsiella pneumoniae]